MSCYEDLISPQAVHAAAARLERNNLQFRSFLKNHADEDKLDQQFLEVHRELFADYDCCQCGNCCRAYSTTVEDHEIEPIAVCLGMGRQEIVDTYLVQDHGGFLLKAPCPFLEQDGTCKIQVCKPKECQDFPYTDKPERLHSLYGMLSFAEECPVVFEILERLKRIYGFRNRE